MTPQFKLSRLATSVRRVCQGAMTIAVLAATASLAKAQLIYTEDFNSDGAGTRYTVEGGGFVPKNGQVVPVPAGTSYWGRNTEVVAKGEVVGVPFPAPARRAIMLFNHGLDPSLLTADGKKLIDETIKWLTDGKAKMVVMFSAPAGAESLGDQYLISTLTAAGHTVIDDDTAVTLPEKIASDKVDLIINSSTGGDPIRLANAAVPLLSFASDLEGDMLLATRGSTDLTFDPGNVKVETATHPIAAGLPASFKFVTEAQPLDTIGLGLPAGSITVASYQFTDDAGTVSTRPFLVVTEKGVQLLGGLISGMEGSGYWAGADLNEPNISTPPDDPARTGPLAGRSLTLREVDVTGKSNLKVTFALAGTEVDFDGPGGDDYLSIKVDLDGSGPGEFIELARYGSPTAAEKFLVEMIKGGDGQGGPAELVKPDYTKRVGIVAKDFTYDIPDGATKLVVRFEGLCTFWNEIMAFDNIRIHSGNLQPPANVGQPTELGQTVNGFQDDFKGATRDPNWVPRGPGGDLYKQEDGLLRVNVRAGDPNHLLYEAPGYSNNVQEVLARIRITSFGTGDGPRGGIGVGVQTTPAAELSRGINLHFRNFLQDNVPGRQFKLLDDARAWGPPGLKIDWETNQWFWLRLRQDPNAGGGTDDVFGKVWLADGKTAEPADWQLKWNYIPTRTARVGFAGITGSSIDGLSAFEVDYILIKAAGLPEVKVNFDPLGPAPTTPKFTRIQAVGTNIEFEWIGAGILQQADDPGGPWTNVANAGSPRRVAIGTTTAKFYRLRP